MIFLKKYKKAIMHFILSIIIYVILDAIILKISGNRCGQWLAYAWQSFRH